MDLNDTYELNTRKTVEGFLRVWLQNPNTGEILESRTTRNVITYSAADVMAKSVAGDSNYKLTHIYFQYGGASYVAGALPGAVVAARDDVMANLTDDGASTANAESPIISYGFARTPDPPGRYAHNIVTVTALAGDPSLDGQIVSGAGLVARVSGTDILFAHQYFLGLTKLSQFQIVAAWSIRYL